MRTPLALLDAACRYLLPSATICALIAAAVLVLPPSLSAPSTFVVEEVDHIHDVDELADPSPDVERVLMAASADLDSEVGRAAPVMAEAPVAAPSTRQERSHRPRPSAELPIVMYHHIGPLPANPDAIRRDLTVSPATFAGQLKYLAERGIKTVHLDALMEHLAGGAELPTRSVVLTFDDGYDDNYEFAFPLLREYGMVGTFFITTDLIGRPGYMSWGQLEEMAAAGMSIQAHSVDHADLTAVAPAELKRQLAVPKQLLEERLGHSVRFLAYPAGKHNRAVIVATKAAGYEAAVTVNQGIVQSSNGPYELLRVRARGADSVEQLLARITPTSWRTTARQ